MASGGSNLPAFQDIIRRGSASEPRSSRPLPKVNRAGQRGDLSLSAAVHAARISESHSLNNKAAAASEPKKTKHKGNTPEVNSNGEPSESRRRTPMTMPRTKVTANTPLEQRIALKKLKQRLNFEKEDDKQAKPQKVKKESYQQKQIHSLTPDVISLSSIATVSDYAESELSEFNSGKLSERLDQVRNYLKEATTMYVSLSASGTKEPKQTEQMNKLAKLIQQLRIQEKGYLELLQKTLAMDEVNSIAESITSVAETASVGTASMVSGDEGFAEANNSQLFDALKNATANKSSVDQVNELERLREQQGLLKKIVEQQKELKLLKDRQATLLEMQQDAETFMQDQREQRKQDSVPNNQRRSDAVRQNQIQHRDQKAEQTASVDLSTDNDESAGQEAYAQKRLELEQKLNELQEKKQQMDKLADMLKALSGAQNGEDALNQGDLSEVLSDVLTMPLEEDVNVPPDDDMDVQEKIEKLNDVRDRLHELKSMVADYEQASTQTSPSKTDASRDNRLHAQAIQQQQGNTMTGEGGARLRIPNGDYLLNDLQALQNGIEELMDNRIKPVPASQQKAKIDVTRNHPSTLRTKNTNQEKRPANSSFNENRDISAEYMEKMRELQLARSRLSDQNYVHSDTTSVASASIPVDGELISESEVESDASSALQWQDDPEFQNKVKKLNMAKKKLHRLQELVRVVQQSDGPQLPIDDLVDLTISQSEDFNDTSAYGESEEEAEDDDEDEEDEETCDDEDGGDPIVDENVDEGASDFSKSTDTNLNFAPENGLSDNERRYQGLLRKQRLELNYLLKERERLLEAQQKLTTLATTASSTHTQTQSVASSSVTKKSNASKGSRGSKNSKASHKNKEVAYPVLTKAELNKQNNRKGPGNKNPFKFKMDGMSVEPHYGSEHEIYPPDISVDGSMTVPLSNPMAVTEIRRQRELFEQKKKQKFVEKQRRKRKNRPDENQSDDHATYSVHSDVDEGVGVSMFSADVTTAGTWGGSTVQSSSEEDSAVDEDYAPSGQIETVDGEVDEDFNGSQFDQAEEEEEEGSGANNVPPVFKVKKYGNDEEQPRRGISWLNDVTPKKKNPFPTGSVSWSLDVSPPRSRKKLRQGNLTPAHKLIQDNKRKRRPETQYPDSPSSKDGETDDPAQPLQTQLASMCTSLLRNEQTLLSMLQNQYTVRSDSGFGQPAQFSSASNQEAINNIQDYLTTSNYKVAYQETLEALKSCYERVEQHQLDMEYLRQQFSRLNTATEPTLSPPKPSEYPKPAAADYQSPWPNAPSLHMSSFGRENQVNAEGYFSTAIPSCLRPSDGYPKGTQTEATLFDDPFKPMQQYSLFGEEEKLTTPVKETQQGNFNFNPVLDHTSPGAIGERTFFQQQFTEPSEASIMQQFPYRLRMSEYNPMSYQGLPETHTGNVVTMSKMSLHKDKAETFISEQSDKNIWPSFFKLTESNVAADNASDVDAKHTGGSLVDATNGLHKDSVVNSPKTEDDNTPRESGNGSNLSLFEALRDNIYSEVATLIAMNESRPHYLIELFRELQLLNSDYLRQRALYSIQELVTRFLTDENTSPNKTAFTKETIQSSGGVLQGSYGQWVASGSEQTPSESVITTDDESESQVLQTLSRQMQNNEIYDYAELADTQSDGNLSTPGSHSDVPFAADDLGNTVINLDEEKDYFTRRDVKFQALDRMKSYEEGMANARKAIGLSPIAPNILSSPERRSAAYEAVKKRVDLHRESASESSACDAVSEASSDMPQPSVDTQKLDRQIKAVMLDLIPYLNENIEGTCTEELLDEIRNLIVRFARDKEPRAGKEEFGRFFHTQLDSILKDSLLKFQARKLRECGEDILVDVSEILFNELAFFRLMQDLDRPLYNGNPSEGNEINETATAQIPSTQVAGADYDESSAAESTSTLDNEISTVQTSSPASTSSSNAYVMVERVEISDDDTESARQFVNVELSVSETRPIRSTGSGEDDNEEEPSQFSTASVPASSIHLYSQAVQANQPTASSSTLVGEEVNVEADEPTPEDDRAHQQVPVQNELQEGAVEGQNELDAVEVENESAEDERDLEDVVDAVEADVVESDGAEGQAIIVQQDLEEGGTEDDLTEADMATEESAHIQQQHQAAQVVLAHLDGQQELAGDPNALPVVNPEQ